MTSTLRYITSLLLLLSIQFAVAQVQDDFTDGDFSTAPAWIGDASDWEIDAFSALHLNVVPAAEGESYLSTASTAIEDATWELDVRMDFNPSAGNRCYVYLVSDAANLEESLQGYYVLIGNGDDEISLYRQDGSNSTKIIDGLDDVVDLSAVELRLRVTRDALGNWELSHDVGATGTFVSEGTVMDDTYTSTSHFGMRCDYTSTRADAFYFDNIVVTGTGAVDNTPPAVIAVEVLTAQSLSIQFNEPVDEVSAETISAYTVLPFNSATQAVLTGQALEIGFASPFPENVLQQLQVEGVMDIAGNAMGTQVLNFVNAVTGVAEPGDVVINEIMADPADSVALPEREFIELFNTSDEAFDLEGWRWTNSALAELLDSYILLPGAYVILCDDSDAEAFLPYGDVLAVAAFGALSNASDDLGLRNADNIVIDEVSYTDDWYQDPDRDDGGYSLERKNPFTPCSGISNWGASLDPDGGTPGDVNSIFVASDDIAPQLISLGVPDPQLIVLTFDEGLDEASVLAGAYTLSPALDFSPQVGATTATLELFLTTPLQVGVAYTLTAADVTDCVGNLIAPISEVLYLPELAEGGELIINEIMADPSPSAGLPEFEYIEIFNRSDKVIDLATVQLLNSGSAAELPAYILLPGEYVIISGTDGAAAFSAFGPTIAASTFTALGNTGDDLSLIANGSVLLDEVSYDISWYADPDRSDGGYALERKNPFSTCQHPSNWAASTAGIGGTPAQENSGFIASDEIAPTVSAIAVDAQGAIIIEFDEGMDELSFMLSSYALSPSASLSAQFGVLSSTLILTPNAALTAGQEYDLSISGPEDCSANAMLDTVITFFVPDSITGDEIVINEIMVDPAPVIGLPDTEYIELYNRSDKVIQISQITLLVDEDPVSLPNYALLPDAYVILCAADEFALYADYPNAVAVIDYRDMSNSGDLLQLIGPAGELMDEVDYTIDWYNNPSRDDGGYSIERVNYELPCNDVRNWRASTANAGGTPGAVNSVLDLSPDTRRPEPIYALVIGEGQLEVAFDEPMSPDSFQLMDFTITPALSVNAIQVLDAKTVTLSLAEVMTAGVIYELVVSMASDCVGNDIVEIPLPFALADDYEPGDIVINEVLFNPRTGGADFVEIYNRSTRIISLNGWQLARKNMGIIDEVDPITLRDFLILPGSFRLLTDDDFDVARNYPLSAKRNFLEVTDVPSYSNDEGTVVLLEPNGDPHDEFYYNEDYHFALLDDVSGVSLERIDYNRLTNDPSNWHSAAETVGFATPGYTNSQLQPASIVDNAFSLEPEVFSPDNDGFQDVLNISYDLDAPGSLANITIYDRDGRRIRTLTRNTLLATSGTLSWDGIKDDRSKANIGVYIVLIELFDPEGNTSSSKKTCVLGGRL